MIVVADTSVLIDHLRDHRPATAALKLASKHGNRVSASVLSLIELWAGMLPGEDVLTRSMAATIHWIPVSIEIAERASELANQYWRSHSEVDVVDYVIAATSESLQAELWTGNVKHFPMFPGLEPPY